VAETLQFPCARCGSRLHYEPGTEDLSCGSCGHTQPVPPGIGPIVEYPLADGLAAAKRVTAKELDADEEHSLAHCDGCGASFVLDDHAKRCLYCDSPVVVVADEREELAPESLLPFRITREDARAAFKKWVRSRWFAPNDFSKRARRQGMDGIYLPHWTYDAHAATRYSGQRGEHYWVTETYRDSDGKMKTRQVRHTRWYPAAGSVEDLFDDVLLCASKALPLSLTDELEPWDLLELKSFSAGYLSGFSAERYAVEVDEGLKLAQDRKMIPAIATHVRRDIGGDEQRITRMEHAWADITFKLTLLPLWIASFRYGEDVYRFAVNGRTGEAQGERPWSKWKIAFAVLAGLLVAGTVAFLTQDQ
jgi:hypothetical protein